MNVENSAGLSCTSVQLEHADEPAAVALDLQQVVEVELGLAEERARALLLELDHLAQQHADGRPSTCRRSRSSSAAPSPVRCCSTARRSEKSSSGRSAVVAVLEHQREHARLRLVEAEHLGEQQRTERRHGRAQLRAALAGQAQELDREARPAARRSRCRCARVVDARRSPRPARRCPTTSPFMSARNTGTPARRQLLGDQLQRLGLAGAGGAGDQAVAVQHRERHARPAARAGTRRRAPARRGSRTSPPRETRRARPRGAGGPCGSLREATAAPAAGFRRVSCSRPGSAPRMRARCADSPSQLRSPRSRSCTRRRSSRCFRPAGSGSSTTATSGSRWKRCSRAASGTSRCPGRAASWIRSSVFNPIPRPFSVVRDGRLYSVFSPSSRALHAPVPRARRRRAMPAAAAGFARAARIHRQDRGSRWTPAARRRARDPGRRPRDPPLVLCRRLLGARGRREPVRGLGGARGRVPAARFAAAALLLRARGSRWPRACATRSCCFCGRARRAGFAGDAAAAAAHGRDLRRRARGGAAAARALPTAFRSGDAAGLPPDAWIRAARG